MPPRNLQRLSLARILALARKPAWRLHRLHALAALLLHLPASSSSLCFAQSASHPLDAGIAAVGLALPSWAKSQIYQEIAATSVDMRIK